MSKIFTFLPDCFNAFVRKLDNYTGGIETVPGFHGRSLLAFFVPLLVYAFIVFGPSLARDADGGIVWRGGLRAGLLLVGAVAIQLTYFLQNKWRGMAWVQLGLVVALSLAVWFFGKGFTQASGGLYRHYYGLLASIAVLIAVPLAAWLRRRKLFVLPDGIIKKFKDNFDAESVVARSGSKSGVWDVIGAFILAILRTPLHVITPIAFVVLGVSPDHLKFWAILTAAFSLILFARSSFDPERDAFFRFIHRTFLTGGSLIVTLAIVIFAVLRLAGVQYVTTILDAGSRITIFAYIVSAYALFWLYDFWVNQAILDLLGIPDRLKPKFGSVQRHGGGRIVVTADSGRNRVFEPGTLVRRIAVTAPESEKTELRREASRAEQRFRTFAIICLAVFGIVLYLTGLHLHKLKQEPALAASDVAAEEANDRFFNFNERLTSSGSEPVVLLAASGGGTRAALYTTSVLHGLSRLGKLDRLILASGVSGGSAAIAYFAVMRPRLIENDKDAWLLMRETLSAPFIDDVLAGAAEWRIVSNVRLGKLLSESFERRFLATPVADRTANSRTTFGDIEEMGLIINSSLCGAPAIKDVLGFRESVERAGGRLVITNFISNFDTGRKTGDPGWVPDMPYVVIKDPKASLFDAIALSANFPAVFSNAAVDWNGKRYWVTDGGAVENRGVISILLALIEELEKIKKKAAETGKKQDLADIRLIVADASALQTDYKSDRGLGAKFSASEKLANRLIKELCERAEALHKSISDRDGGFQVVDLPMPDAMRAAGTFGTHWMMPATVTIRDPLSNQENGGGIVLEDGEAKEIIDALFLDEYSASYITRRWPGLDAEGIVELTGEPWYRLYDGLK